MKKIMMILAALALIAGSASAALLENWDFEAGDEKSTVTGTTLAGGVNIGHTVVGGEIVYDRGTGTGASFKSFKDEAYAGADSGVYQISYDIVAADFALTAAADGNAQFGFGARFNDGSNKDLNALFRYNGTSDQFQLSLKTAEGNQTVALADGTTIADVNVRQVVDIDAGTYNVWYTIGAGSEQLAYSGATYADQTIGEFRQQMQTINGGNNMVAGDTLTMDNITVEAIPEPATIGMLGLGALVTMFVRRMKNA